MIFQINWFNIFFSRFGFWNSLGFSSTTSLPIQKLIPQNRAPLHEYIYIKTCISPILGIYSINHHNRLVSEVMMLVSMSEFVCCIFFVFLTTNWKILQNGNYLAISAEIFIIIVILSLRRVSSTQELINMIQGIIPEKLLDAGLFLQLLSDAGYVAPPAYLTQSDFLALMSRMVCKSQQW